MFKVLVSSNQFDNLTTYFPNNWVAQNGASPTFKRYYSVAMTTVVLLGCFAFGSLPIPYLSYCFLITKGFINCFPFCLDFVLPVIRSGSLYNKEINGSPNACPDFFSGFQRNLCINMLYSLTTLV